MEFNVDVRKVAQQNVDEKECINQIQQLSASKPLVMCVTNLVTPLRVADILLATGASPIMIENEEECLSIASISKAIYFNMGLQKGQISSIEEFQKRIESNSIIPPIIVDPVGYGASSYRNQIISEFLTTIQRKHFLAAIKGNAAEISALAKDLGGYEEVKTFQEEGSQVQTSDVRKNQGVDSEAYTSSAINAGIHLAKALNTIIGISGDHDIIISACGSKVTRIKGDNPLMARITGTGCALGAVVAAAIGSVSPSSLEKSILQHQYYIAVVSAHYLYTAASMKAKERPEVRGPGSLSITFSDELYYLSENSAELPSWAGLESIAT